MVLLDLVMTAYRFLWYDDTITSVVNWMFQVFLVCKIGGISHLVSRQWVRSHNTRIRGEDDIWSGNRLSLSSLEGFSCNGLSCSERCGA